MIPSYKLTNNLEQSQNPKPKKDKNSLHNLPKLDKTQLYFNSHHTQTPLSYKVLKTNATDVAPNSKTYFLNNNLKRATNKPKTLKEQNKSITNFLDITISQNFANKEYNTRSTPDNPSKIKNDDNFESKSGEAKFSKLHIKHKNSYGNSINLDKPGINEKTLRPSLYESSSMKTKEYFHQQTLNKGKLQKVETKQPEKNELEVILTEASETNINEFGNAETRQAILTLFTPETFFGNKNCNSVEKGDKKKNIEKQENEVAGISDFIVKNKDTGCD